MTTQNPAPPPLDSPATEKGVRPQITLPHAGLSKAAITIGVVLAAILLFSILESRRQALQAPAVRPIRADLAASSEPLPALFIPPVVPRERDTGIGTLERSTPPKPAPVPHYVAPASPMPPAPVPGPPSGSYYTPPPEVTPPSRTSGGAILVVDNAQSQPTGSRGGASEAPASAATSNAAMRVRAGALSNHAATVPQGTLIPAVLETAIDSTGAGFARALVQRDVHGFDGSAILIPRGSRLLGEYQSTTAPGQKRAFVTWTRLIRPDGVTIAIGSPATNPVGVGGIRAKVNRHFFERFAGSILQSAMLIGGNLAARSVGDSVIIAMPGSLPGAGTTTQATQIPPTLTVRQGTSISVFVARDLDFTGADTPR